MKSYGKFRKREFSYKLFALIIFTFVVLSLFTNVLLAKPVNSAQAEKAVNGWLKTDAKPLGASLGKEVVATDIFNGTDGIPAYYIIYLNPAGFVIVAADDSIEPVVGFVAGPAIYDPSPANPLGTLVTHDMAGRLDVVRKLQKKLDAGAKKKDLTSDDAALNDEAGKAQGKWKNLQAYADFLPPPTGIGTVSDVRVAPLVQTKWGQDNICSGYCYNYYTPSHYYSGCVATAFAQVLKYFEWPQTGIGVHAFSISAGGHGTTASTRGGDGLGGPYDWGQMVLNPSANCGSFTETQRQAIGALMVDAGVTVHMEYASNGSGAWVRNVKTALTSTFLYTNAIRAGDESANLDATYRNMIMNTNLDAGLPMEIAIYAGSNTGHAVVVDGYGYNSGTLYHHVNLGWDGAEDAWYALPTIDAGYNFNTIVACIYNIYKTGTGEIISGRVTYGNGSPFVGATVTATGTGGPFTATTNDKGIYALTKVRSATAYTISVSSSGCTFSPASINVTTGTSVDGTSSSAGTTGNKWGNDFTTTCSPPSPPPAPATISYPTSSSSGVYTVSWSSSTGASSYTLERSNNSGSSWTSVYSGTNLSYAENITDGTYRYHVKATNGGGSSAWTTGTWDCVVSLTPPVPPLPPASITYPASSTGKHTISWASSDGATLYPLERFSTDGNSWTSLGNITGTSYQDTITDGTYRYRVKAKNIAGESDWTTGTTDCIVVVPPPVTVAFNAGTSAGWDFYELAGDIARNNTVDMDDLNIIAQNWLNSSCSVGNQWCGGSDMDDSNQVDLLDYARLVNDWGKQAGENVLLQTIYGSAQNSVGQITANASHALSVGKECLMVFNVPQATILDKGWFKLVGLKPSYTFRVRMFNVTGQGYLNTGHTITKASLDSGSPLVDVSLPTGSSPVPGHAEGTQTATDMIINFGPMSIAAGDYLIVFNNVSGGNTIGSIVRGVGSTVAAAMGKYSDGALLPKRATVTTTAGVGNTYFYYLDTSSSTNYQPAANLLAFQMTMIVNHAPVVDAGPDQTIALSEITNLASTVTDDGLPNPPGYFTTQWTQQSGPGTVTFTDGFLGMTASFSEAGVYVLRLTANDGSLSAYDEVTITVE